MGFFIGRTMEEIEKANIPRDFAENSEVIFLPSSCCVFHKSLF